MLGARRAVLAAVAGGALLPLVVPAPALAASQLGTHFFANDPNSCAGAPDFEAFQVGRANTSVTSTVPYAGVITSWTYGASEAQTTLITMRVFRPTGTPDGYAVVADAGALETVTPSDGTSTFPTRVGVQAGDVIGVHAQGGDCATGGTASDVIRSRTGAATVAGAVASYPATTHATLDLSAVLEPDADGDGFGDDSQDACPTRAALQVPCPTPETEIEGRVQPQRATTRLTLASSLAGAIFTCTLDKHRPQACRAKLRYHCLKAGRHTLSAFATSPVGVPDPTPAVLKFRLQRHRQGC